MFEMLVLLINEINPHSFCFVTCFLFIFTSEALPHRGLLHTIFYIAYLRICRRNLPWLFTVRICRRFFVYVRECFFVYVNKSCLHGSKTFLYVSKTFWFVSHSSYFLFLDKTYNNQNQEGFTEQHLCWRSLFDKVAGL